MPFVLSTNYDAKYEGIRVLSSGNLQDSWTERTIGALNYIDTDYKEFYYSVNKKDVVRGMHFQTPPVDHTKVVYVSRGRIKDVVVDIRKNSATYGQYFDIELDDQKGQYLYIPKGFAHGFLSLEDGSIVNYAQTTCYSKDNGCGIDSLFVGYDWGVENVIRSGRDLTFEKLSVFNSPF